MGENESAEMLLLLTTMDASAVRACWCIEATGGDIVKLNDAVKESCR